jgi:ketosteroid isomerase-like protein
MKTSLILLLLTIRFFVYAQEPAIAVLSMAQAERDFAALSKKQNTKEAFLANLADSGIIFRNGSPVNGIASYQPRPIKNDLLFWEPVFADAASSGDLGYTTGPWYYWPERKDTLASYYGYYSTIWIKDNNGVWKVMVDIGIGLPQAEKDKPVFNTASTPWKKNSSKLNKEKEKNKLLVLEKNYIAALNGGSVSFKKKFFSKEGRIYRGNYYPVIGENAIAAFSESGKKFQHTFIAADIAASADMAYAYGQVRVKSTQDGTAKEETGNYLRVWKRENGKDWKIVLDVIGGL